VLGFGVLISSPLSDAYVALPRGCGPSRLGRGGLEM
jgi:hypothetical protein